MFVGKYFVGYKFIIKQIRYKLLFYFIYLKDIYENVIYSTFKILINSFFVDVDIKKLYINNTKKKFMV